jgi:hypothetical protein
MTVEVVQGNPYPQTLIRVKPKQTPLSDDNASVEKWLKEQPELFKYYKKFTYDEMKSALQDWLNPEDSVESPSVPRITPKKEEGYTLNVKQKESFNEDEFDDLFKD